MRKIFTPQKKQAYNETAKAVRALVLLCTILMASSCAKEGQLPVPDGLGPLAEARARFENRGGTTDPDTSGMAYRQKKEGLLQWQDASLEVHGDTTTIFVPLHTDI